HLTGKNLTNGPCVVSRGGTAEVNLRPPTFYEVEVSPAGIFGNDDVSRLESDRLTYGGEFCYLVTIKVFAHH
ncbi:MAG: hypothetical protein GWO26_27685, partial [Phycisphaerae bacterium]|nr:hypothetical protein [Phycisphaerae bacterium]